MNFAATPFDIKALAADGRIEGIAASFNNVDHGGDRLLPGCFTKALTSRGPRPLPMLFGHDLNRPIGAWTELREQADGLHVAGKMTLATRDAQEAYALAKDGALTGLSIGWKSVEATYEGDVRVVREAELFETSLVAVPMNDQARVTGLKTFATAKDFADLFREAGLSSRKAKAAAGAAWKAIHDQDDEAAAESELAAILNASIARLTGR